MDIVLDNSTHYKTKSVHFLGLMNSATKLGFRGFRGLGVRLKGFTRDWGSRFGELIWEFPKIRGTLLWGP